LSILPGNSHELRAFSLRICDISGVVDQLLQLADKFSMGHNIMILDTITSAFSYVM